MLTNVVRIMKALVGSWDWGSEGDGFIRTLGRDGAGVGDWSIHLGHQDGVAGVRGDEDALKVFLLPELLAVISWGDQLLLNRVKCDILHIILGRLHQLAVFQNHSLVSGGIVD